MAPRVQLNNATSRLLQYNPHTKIASVKLLLASSPPLTILLLFCSAMIMAKSKNFIKGLVYSIRCLGLLRENAVCCCVVTILWLGLELVLASLVMKPSKLGNCYSVGNFGIKKRVGKTDLLCYS